MNISVDAFISAALDQRFYLVGDEDTGVGLHCRPCDTGGRPIAYLAGLGAYEDVKVPTVLTIPALIEQAAEHVAGTHREATPE